MMPCMKDRAMQALYLLALDPIAEVISDPNSYGFRQERSPADAIEQCFSDLSRQNCAQWILEGDIKSCCDQISHEWLLAHIPILGLKLVTGTVVLVCIAKWIGQPGKSFESK